MIIDAYNYMTNESFNGYKLSNLQYRNDVDADNRYKKAPIYAEDIGELSLSRFMDLADK